MKKTIYSPEQASFLALLRQARQNAGLTQADLAQRLGVPQSRISDYERGERQMDLMQLRQYCRGVEVDLVEFVKRFDALVKSDSGGGQLGVKMAGSDGGFKADSV